MHPDLQLLLTVAAVIGVPSLVIIGSLTLLGRWADARVRRSLRGDR